jgi:alpha-1,6-mannosyltransferase
MHVADVTMLYGAESGAVRRYLEAKHCHLRRRGDEHSLVVPLPSAGAGTSGARSVPWNWGSGSLGWPRSAAERILAEKRPDVIEAGDPFGTAWAASRAARRLKVPAVAFCHRDLAASAARFAGRGGCRAAGAYLRRLYDRFDLVLAPSAAMLERLDAVGVRRLACQPLGVDLELFHPARATPIWRARAGAPPGARLAVHLGRLAPEKNLDVLAAAFERLGPSYFLLLAGTGRAPSLPRNARAIPYLRDPADVAALLASADLMVHAGDEETGGMAALEALACGLPVVAPRAGVFLERIDDAVGTLVRPGDPDALADAIRFTCARNRNALAHAARRRAERFGWNHVLGQLCRRYEHLREEGHGQPRPVPALDTHA